MQTNFDPMDPPDRQKLWSESPTCAKCEREGPKLDCYRKRRCKSGTFGIHGCWPFDSFLSDSVWHASNGPTSVRVASLGGWSASVLVATSKPGEPSAAMNFQGARVSRFLHWSNGFLMTMQCSTIQMAPQKHHILYICKENNTFLKP